MQGRRLAKGSIYIHIPLLSHWNSRIGSRRRRGRRLLYCIDQYNRIGGSIVDHCTSGSGAGSASYRIPDDTNNTMLPRTLQRSLRRLPTKQEVCNVCSCRCGTQFSSRPFSTSTPVHASGRRAPSTRTTMNRRDPIPLSTMDREDAEYWKNKQQGRVETNNALRYATIDKAYKDGQFGMLADEVDKQSFAARRECASVLWLPRASLKCWRNTAWTSRT
jgi:hypothetical protein